MNRVALLALGLLVIVFSSCEGYTDRTWRITNASKSPLSFKVRSMVQNHDSLVILPGETKQIAHYSQMGGNENPGKTSDQFSVIEFISPKDSTKKEFSQNPNWNVATTQERRIPSRYDHDFKLVVTDKDL
jgi:hypothetical protein